MTEPNDKPAAPRCPAILAWATGPTTLDSSHGLPQCEREYGHTGNHHIGHEATLRTEWPAADSAVSAEPPYADGSPVVNEVYMPPQARAAALTQEEKWLALYANDWRREHPRPSGQKAVNRLTHGFLIDALHAYTADLQRQLEQAQELNIENGLCEKHKWLKGNIDSHRCVQCDQCARDRLAAEVERLRELMGRVHDKLKVILPKVDGIIGLQQARTGYPIYDGPTLVEEMKELAALRTQQEGGNG